MNIFYISILHLLEFFYSFLNLLVSDDSSENCGIIRKILWTPERNEIFDNKRTKYICYHCGRAISDDFKICSDCLAKPVFPSVSYARHVTAYGKKQKLFMKMWKFKANRILSITAAIKLFECYKKYFGDLPVIPIPPRKERIMEAGFDCINDMAFIFKWCFKVKVLKPLIRVDSEEQKHKKFADRVNKAKIRYAFKSDFQIDYESVVLIDDIMTTGGTIEECAAILRAAGVKEVFALTLFYA